MTIPKSERGTGLLPLPHDPRDYDFVKTKRLTGAVMAFPDSYSTDRGLWMPNQDEGCDLFAPPVPPLPEGCTDYAQSDLLTDEDGRLFNPMELEAITHANEGGGTDLRTSFEAVVKLHKDHPKYFSVQPDINRGGVLDYFDAARVAMIVGKNENRAVSVGTQWFESFNNVGRNGILPEPSGGFSWHNWAVKGWKTINGEVYLIGKPWCGKRFGDQGFCYISRAIFNQLMSARGTVAYVLDKLTDGEQPQRIDTTIAQWLVSLFTRLFSRT